MSKKIFLFLLIGVFAGISSVSAAASLNERLKGKILLQVEENGEGWYVNPDDSSRHYLGRPTDAFQIMRKLGLGITNANFDSFKGVAPKRLSGKILLKVEDLGKAYYVNPTDLAMHYLGRPEDAFQVMRKLGLGITNTDLAKINISKNSALPQTKTDKMNDGISSSVSLNPVENLPESNPFENADINPFSDAKTNPFK